MWTTIEPSVTLSTIAVLGDGNQPNILFAPDSY